MLSRLRAAYRNIVPEEVRKSQTYRALRQAPKNVMLRHRFGVDDIKLAREAYFWQRQFDNEGGKLRNPHYKGLFLGIAKEEDASFTDGKVIADFGCGPRGSLLWAEKARARIGIDVLVPVYERFGIQQHDMIYVTSSEVQIPLASDSVDILCTLNALDHVHNLEPMCNELIRILKPGGTFIGSFNLHEKASFAEPQTLDEGKLQRNLLHAFHIEHTRRGPKGTENTYEFMTGEKETPLRPGQPGLLWVRATKR